MALNFAEVRSFATVLWQGELLLDREINIGTRTLVDEVSEALDTTFDETVRLFARYGLMAGNADETTTGHGIPETLTQILSPLMHRLASEIKKVLVYIGAETQGGGISAVYILGGVARWSGIDETLGNLIATPVKTINPFFGLRYENVEFNPELAPVSGIAVATGLALREVSRDV